MEVFKKSILLSFLLFLFFTSVFSQEECTTVVVSGSRTVDGRPLLWKNRDTSEQDNMVLYFSGGIYEVVGVVTAGNTSSIWMGINSAGFAIENSLSLDLEGTSTGENGIFMKNALQNCASVDEFEQLLINTNNPGRATKANFGIIDATGAAAIFETGNHTYAKFDANDPLSAPLGFIVRTNFAFTGDGTGGGQERYNRAVNLFTQKAQTSEISHEYILREVSRDLKNDQINPYPLPYEGTQNGHALGYIRTNYSINRYTTRSSAVFHGILPGEDPRLSTMWVILGEPACSVSVPIWVHAGATPAEMKGSTTAPMCDLSKIKKELCYTDTTADSLSYQYIDTFALDNGSGSGILNYSIPIEDWTFSQTNIILNFWRNSFPTSIEIKDFEEDVVSQTYCFFLNSSAPTEISAPLNFSGETVLNRSLSQAEYINVLTWQQNQNNHNIEMYRIYLIEGPNKTLIGEIHPDIFEYWHRNVDNSRQYNYSIVPVNNQGQEGNPACTTVGANIDTQKKSRKTNTNTTGYGLGLISLDFNISKIGTPLRTPQQILRSPKKKTRWK